jgi:hypothetical protein
MQNSLAINAPSLVPLSWDPEFCTIPASSMLIEFSKDHIVNSANFRDVSAV